MIAAIVNALGILIGGTAGTLLRAKINHKLVDCLMTAMGLVVVSVGVQGIIGSSNTMCLVLCLAIGAVIGQALKIDEFIDGMGVRAAKLFEGKKFAEGRFADGVISASVMFTVGAMAIMGSLDAGLRGNYSVLYTKTVIDAVSAAAMSAAMCRRATVCTAPATCRAMSAQATASPAAMSAATCPQTTACAAAMCRATSAQATVCIAVPSSAM